MNMIFVDINSLADTDSVQFDKDTQVPKRAESDQIVKALQATGDRVVVVLSSKHAFMRVCQHEWVQKHYPNLVTCDWDYYKTHVSLL